MTVNVDGIPQALKTKARWILWKLEEVDGKPTKVPYIAHPTKTNRANVTDGDNWSNIDRALECLNSRGDISGIGYCLADDDNTVFFDFDHCINDGVIDEQVDTLVKELNSYTEVSQSGRGLHVIVGSPAPTFDVKNKVKNHHCNIDYETYYDGRYVAITGSIMPGYPTEVRDNPSAVEKAWKEHFNKSPVTRVDVSSTYHGKTNDELWRLMFSSKNGPDIANLFAGVSSSGDDSADDMSLLNHLAFWTGRDPAQMESMFNESALGKRIKWAKRADYRNMSIERAIQDCVGVYTHAPTAKLNLTESLNQINTESALVDNKALKHPWISAFKWTTSSDGVMRIKGINIDTIADLIAPQFAYVDHLIWKKNGRVLTLVHNGDLEREIGMQLKAADARRLMNKETIPKLKLYLASSCEQVEAKSHADKRIAVKNGVLNIVTGELDEDNTDYFTAGLPIEYEPEATCPTIDKFLDESFTSDQKEFILSIFGAVLSGKEVQHILALIGEGRNGKGILEAIIKETFGKTWTNAKADTLDSRFANDAFIGVRIVWQEEVPSSRKGQENLKRISGGATINIEVKNAQGVHPECVQALVVLDTNNPPAFESGSAMDNRLRVVQMPYVFKDEPVAETKNEKKRDPLLKEMVLKELSGFLNKLLPYAKYYYINGRLKHDLAVNRELLDAQSSSLQSFIDKFGEEDEPEIVRNCYGDERTRYVVTRKCDKKTFLKYYELYCKEIGKAMEPSSHIWYLMRNELKFKIRNTSIQGLSIDKAKKHYVESPLISAKNFKDTRGEIKTKDSG